MPDINTPINDELDVDDSAEIQEMHDFDYDQVGKLLSIVEKIATVAPKATAISGIALAELEVLNNKAKDIARDRAQKIKEAEQRRYIAEQERVAADAERQEQEQADAQDQTNRPQVMSPPAPGMPSPNRQLPRETDPVRPSAHPSGSRTATVADANVDRRV